MTTSTSTSVILGALGVSASSFTDLVTYVFGAVFNALIYIVQLFTPFWIALAIVGAIVGLIYGAWRLFHRHA